MVRYAAHVKNRAPILSNATSDILDHLDLFPYPQDIVVYVLYQPWRRGFPYTAERCFVFSRAWLKKTQVDRWAMIVSAAMPMRWPTVASTSSV